MTRLTRTRLKGIKLNKAVLGLCGEVSGVANRRLSIVDPIKLEEIFPRLKYLALG